eukprot:6194461-Pleurochrysis_carterae.AAC.3
MDGCNTITAGRLEPYEVVTHHGGCSHAFAPFQSARQLVCGLHASQIAGIDKRSQPPTFSANEVCMPDDVLPFLTS